ncbi:excisionase [Lysobacter sp. CA199]|uniref:excisionase n=1 Tax=Lysobacter sp. CA199 TaxID=3455608 RepID=UPI003F8D33A3
MHLMTPQQWADKYFDAGSRPSEVTLRRWLNEGKVPGRKVGGSWFVDEHAWQADGDDLVRRVLDAG